MPPRGVDTTAVGDGDGASLGPQSRRCALPAQLWGAFAAFVVDDLCVVDLCVVDACVVDLCGVDACVVDLCDVDVFPVDFLLLA